MFSIDKKLIQLSVLALLLVVIIVPKMVLSQTTLSQSVTVTGNVSVTGSVSKGSGTFVIDHPLDPEDKLLYHS
ncbi:MAG: hypothetical protein WD509_00885, partial [Candidatus Paceibacterota bacterium]